MSYPETSSEESQVTTALVPPISVPTYGSGGSFSVLAKVHISASPAAVLDAVRNTKTWPTWNTFCPSCSFSAENTSISVSGHGTDFPTGHEAYLEVGSICTIVYSMAGDVKEEKGEQGIEVTFLRRLEDQKGESRKGFLIAWKSTGRSSWQLKSERVMEFVDDGNGGTEYACWETFSGVLAVLVKTTVGAKLKDRFGDYARDVKAFTEGGSKVADR